MGLSRGASMKDLYDRLIDFANQNLSTILWFFICSIILLFIPDKYLKFLYIESMVSYIRPIVGFAFILSSSLLFIKTIFFIGSLVSRHKEKNFKRQLLQKLENLCSVTEERSRLTDKQDYIDWGVKVAPLLKFDDNYYVPFMQSLDVLPKRLSNLAISPAIKSMVGLLKMAINDLKNST